LFGLRIAGDFGATIAAPVVLFVLAGQWADARYGGGWRYTVLAFIAAALLSGRLIYRKAKAYGAAYDAIGKTEQTHHE
jgi:hypothetical protein